MGPKRFQQTEDPGLLGGQPEGTRQTELDGGGSERDGSGTVLGRGDGLNAPDPGGNRMGIELHQFLGQAAVLSGTVQKIKGAGDRLCVGLIDRGGRGLYVANYMRKAPGVEFAAVCDVYEPRAEKASEWAGGDARAYRDFRQLLDRKISMPF